MLPGWGDAAGILVGQPRVVPPPAMSRRIAAVVERDVTSLDHTAGEEDLVLGNRDPLTRRPGRQASCPSLARPACRSSPPYSSGPPGGGEDRRRRPAAASAVSRGPRRRPGCRGRRSGRPRPGLLCDPGGARVGVAGGPPRRCVAGAGAATSLAAALPMIPAGPTAPGGRAAATPLALGPGLPGETRFRGGLGPQAGRLEPRGDAQPPRPRPDRQPKWVAGSPA